MRLIDDGVFLKMNEDEREAYLEGFRRAVWLFSVWHDGVEWIGSPECRRADVVAAVEREALHLMAGGS